MNELEQSTPVAAPEAAPQIELDEIKAREFYAKIEEQQNLPAGVMAGLIAAILGAVAWAAITVATGYQIGYMAAGVGFLVGFAVRFFGQGLTTPFAVAGCLLALLGCLLGNLLSVCAFISIHESIPVLQVVSRLNPERAIRLLTATFDVMDVLFYGLALYGGYKYSIRPITPEELQSLAKKKA
jgi:hypothetical protein